jgi:exodeoxyribonuclease V gamma subunit
VTVRHPLQPFDPRNFTSGALSTSGPFSFDPIGFDAAVAAAGPRRAPTPWWVAPLPAPAPADVSLIELTRLLEHPARGFLRQRLDVAVTRAEDETEDALPVELDDLQRYAVAERLLQDRLRGLDPGQCRRRELRRGAMPPGQLGAAGLTAAGQRAEQILAASELERALPPESHDVDVLLSDGCRVVGTVGGVRGTVLLTTTCATLSARHRLHAWVQLVALAASRPEVPWTAVTLGRSGRKVARSVQGPLEPAAARDVLEQLVALYRSGLTGPLPLPVKTAAEYAERRANGSSPTVARMAAARKWDTERYPGESHDGEHGLLHGDDAPLTVLTTQAPLASETGPGWAVDEPDRFGRLARRLWQPLLAAETRAVV